MKRRITSWIPAIILTGILGMIAYGFYSRGLQQCAPKITDSARNEEESNQGLEEPEGGVGNADKKISAIYIVYATETGNCERIAEQLSFEFRDWPCYVRLLSIEDYEVVNSTEVDNTFTIFIASTVGQGDAPAAARPFIKSLKAGKYKIGKCLVVGLGHSAFETYNKCARDLFVDLQRYGNADVIVPAPILIDCADSQFENNALRQIHLHNATIRDYINEFEGLMRQAKSFLEIVDLIVAPNIPRNQIHNARDYGRAGKSSDKAIFDARPAVLTRLESVSANGRYFHLVNISSLGIPDVTVGNAIKLWTPIAESVVDLAFTCFGEHLRDCGVNGQNSGPTSSRLIFPKGISFDSIFRYVIDWTACPPASLMTMIGNAWLDDTDAHTKVIAEVKSRRATLVEYLIYVRTICRKDINLPLILLPSFPRISPRLYTIASGIERIGVKSFNFDLCITETFTMRSLPQGSENKLNLADSHYGRVSGFLKSSLDTTSPFTVLIARGNSVCSLSHAQGGGVWCGAGSGVSMLRSFVDERRKMFNRIKRAPASAPRTSVYMSFRVMAEYRTVDADDLFEFAVANNLIAEAYVTLTREPDVGVFKVTADGLESLLGETSRPKMYLGDVVKRWQPKCYRWLIDQTDGHLIVCGHVGLKENIIKAFEQQEIEKLLSTSRFIAEVW